MARARARRKAPPADRSPEARLIDAALTLAARQGWRRTSLAEIANEAGLKLHEAYALHRSKGAILLAFTRRIDAAVLAGADATGDSARERLFDTLMRRFDALKPYKDGVRAILRDSVGHPAALLALPVLRRSMAWMLEASGISTAGCRGRLVADGTAALYLSVLRVFLADDSEDLGRTMAALDRALRRAEGLCRFVPTARREAPRAA
ncbi:MAG TPA: TetR family transcriptional regulator [Stellaceae bacterium]|nr:TetR family transcriptional regulator [Stellaceae bacterium]